MSKKLSPITTTVKKHSTNAAAVPIVATGTASQKRTAKITAMLKAQKYKVKRDEKAAILDRQKIDNPILNKRSTINSVNKNKPV